MRTAAPTHRPAPTAGTLRREVLRQVRERQPDVKVTFTSRTKSVTFPTGRKGLVLHFTAEREGRAQACLATVCDGTLVCR